MSISYQQLVWLEIIKGPPEEIDRVIAEILAQAITENSKDIKMRQKNGI